MEVFMIKISDAELEVMKIIWKKGETTSIEIIRELDDSKWSDNTIRTLINRLIEKKAIGISRKEGKTYSYVPLIKEDVYSKYEAKKFLNQFFGGSVKKYLAFLIEHEDKTTCDKICDSIRKNLKNK